MSSFLQRQQGILHVLLCRVYCIVLCCVVLVVYKLFLARVRVWSVRAVLAGRWIGLDSSFMEDGSLSSSSLGMNQSSSIVSQSVS